MDADASAPDASLGCYGLASRFAEGRRPRRTGRLDLISPLHARRAFARFGADRAYPTGRDPREVTRGIEVTVNIKPALAMHGALVQGHIVDNARNPSKSWWLARSGRL